MVNVKYLAFKRLLVSRNMLADKAIIEKTLNNF